MFIMPVVWFLVIFFVGQCFGGYLLMGSGRWFGTTTGMLIAWLIICVLLFLFVGEEPAVTYGVFGFIGLCISSYWVSG